MNIDAHYEIERRFLIRMPDTSWLEENTERTEIRQTYLAAQSGDTARVRMRGRDGEFVYTHTVKTRVSAVRRIECEREITQDEYAALLSQADPTRRTIEKMRCCLNFLGQMFEIDIFPFWADRAIMEIELKNEGQTVNLPPDIAVIREITDDSRYTNAALACEIPWEEI